MKISVIVPVYNVAPYIADCIYSVLRQSYRNIELIIVNDCTPDNSMYIINDILASFPFDISIKIIEHPHNKGLSAARNTGIQHSTGDYLFFLDSDDIITDDCIDTLVKSLKKKKANIVFGEYKTDNTDKYYPHLRINTPFLKRNSDIIKVYMKDKMYPMAVNRLIEKKFITEHNLYFKEGLIHEDVLWSFQCMCMAETVSIVKQVTYIYKIRENSITTGIAFKKDFRACVDVLCEIINYAKKLQLQNNKYTHCYIEQRKLELLLLCQKENKPKEFYAPLLYKYIQSFPHAKLHLILIWDFFSIKKLMRDAHYFITTLKDKEEYYWNIPFITNGHLSIRRQISFYGRFLHLLIGFTTKSLFAKKR